MIESILIKSVHFTGVSIKLVVRRAMIRATDYFLTFPSIVGFGVCGYW